MKTPTEEKYMLHMCNTGRLKVRLETSQIVEFFSVPTCCVGTEGKEHFKDKTLTTLIFEVRQHS